MWERDCVEMDLVTHDLRKFARLMLRRNGYVLEQFLSPLVVRTTDTHAESVALAPAVLTRHHAHHYRGFASTQWRLYGRTGELKPLLYTFRAPLTGIHLMRAGEVCAHLPTLLDAVVEALQDGGVGPRPQCAEPLRLPGELLLRRAVHRDSGMSPPPGRTPRRHGRPSRRTGGGSVSGTDAHRLVGAAARQRPQRRQRQRQRQHGRGE